MVIGTVVYEAALNALRRLAQEHHSARQFDRERGAERIEGSTKGGRTKTRGTILEIQPPRRLVHSHWSPVSGLPDAPENHELVTWELDEREGETELTIKEANPVFRGSEGNFGEELAAGPGKPETAPRGVAEGAIRSTSGRCPRDASAVRHFWLRPST